jgi:hypothetical protein
LNAFCNHTGERKLVTLRCKPDAIVTPLCQPADGSVRIFRQPLDHALRDQGCEDAVGRRFIELGQLGHFREPKGFVHVLEAPEDLAGAHDGTIFFSFVFSKA